MVESLAGFEGTNRDETYWNEDGSQNCEASGLAWLEQIVLLQDLCFLAEALGLMRREVLR